MDDHLDNCRVACHNVHDLVDLGSKGRRREREEKINETDIGIGDCGGRGRGRGHLLDLFLQCCIEQLDEKVLFSVVLSVVEHSEHDILQETVCPALWHLEDQLGKVSGMGLKEVEEMLIGL